MGEQIRRAIVQSPILSRILVVVVLTCCAVSAPRTAVAQALPAPWVSADVGRPAVAGRAMESGGTFTVEGAGTDIWGAADQFHFVYQRVTGDVDIRARVGTLEPVHPWTKGGVMIREALTGGSRHAMSLVSNTMGHAFQRRVTTGGTSTHTGGGSGRAPTWVRLVRTGNVFTAYRSADGASWTRMGRQTITMTAQVYVGLAVTSHDRTQAATATFSDADVAVSTPPPPSAWTARDVGDPAIAGESAEASGTFTISGAGGDIWDASDQFHFYYQAVTGDVDIRARLTSLQRQHDWSKAGVMVRAALTGGSQHAYMAGTPSNGWAFQRRPIADGWSIHSPGAATAAPGWVRVVREGDEFSGYESTDGQNWTLVGTETISMPATVYVGLAVTSHNTLAATTATFTNVTLGTPVATNDPPTVSISSPAPGATYTAPASITITASAADSDGTVSRVDFYRGTTLLGSDTSSPYSWTWTNAPAGSYSITARATDDDGATATSAAVTVTVNGNEAPTVAITTPTSGASFTAPATIAIMADASDPDGSIARVEFYQGTTLLGSDTTASYGFTWRNVPAGTYSLTARAVDNTGATTTSAAVTVTVTAPPQRTTLFFNASSNHDTAVDSYTVEIRRAGEPLSATPVAARNLGKPTPANKEISVDISSLIDPLAAGSYYGVVQAAGAGGTAVSTPSANFKR